MKKMMELACELPDGIECSYSGGVFKCKRGNLENSRQIKFPGAKIEISKNSMKIIKEKGNRKDFALLATNIAHVKNMISGLDKKFIYKLEICHVHFPMSVKIQNKEIVIENFLGEKYKRKAKILEEVEVEISGNIITIKGHDLEKTGQTAANLEKATRVPKKDRKIFQDGIFIVSKNGGNI